MLHVTNALPCHHLKYLHLILAEFVYFNAAIFSQAVVPVDFSYI